jgi:tetratricopeptide (TPR) repeat protein
MKRDLINKRIKTVIILAALALLAARPLLAHNGDGGTTSPFELGAGCRIISMGGAATTNWGDSYVLFWNPAGLHAVDRNEIDLFHTSLLDESTYYSAIVLSYPFIDLGVVSLGAVQLRAGEIDQRDASNIEVGGDLENVQTRLLLGYSRSIYRGIALGMNLKVDRFVQDSYVANGFGFDAGFSMRTIVTSYPVDEVRIGASVSNILEPKITLENEEMGDPISLRMGASVHRALSKDHICLAFDMHKSRYSDTHFHLGAEYLVRELLAVRVGLENKQPTLGLGFDLRYFVFDYAYRSTELDAHHLFSLTYRFGRSRSERLEERQQARALEIQREIDEKVSGFEDTFITTALVRGDEHMAAGEYERALEEFNRILLFSPDHEQASAKSALAKGSMFVMRGDSLMAAGLPAEALFAYRQSQEFVPADHITDRIDDCEAMIAETEDRIRIVDQIFAQALEYYSNRHWIEAVSGFDKVLELDPDHALAVEYGNKTREKIQMEHELLLKEVSRLVEQRRYTSAIEELRAALEKYPSDSVLLAKLGDVQDLRAIQARRTSSEKTAQAPKSRPPADSEELRARYERGIKMFTRSDFRNAIKEWEKVWKEYPEFENVAEYLIKAYQFLGMELYAGQRYVSALEMWERILLVDPNNAKAKRYITRTKEELSRFEGIAE